MVSKTVQIKIFKARNLNTNILTINDIIVAGRSSVYGYDLIDSFNISKDKISKIMGVTFNNTSYKQSEIKDISKFLIKAVKYGYNAYKEGKSETITIIDFKKEINKNVYQ